MLSIEIRAAIYAILASLAFLGGWKTKGFIDTDRANELALAQSKVVEAQQAANFAQVTQQAAITAQVSAQYEQKLSEVSASSSALASLVHNYEAQLRSGKLPQVPGTTNGVNATSPGTGSSSGIDSATDAAIQACIADSAQLGELEQWIAQQQAAQPK